MLWISSGCYWFLLWLHMDQVILDYFLGKKKEHTIMTFGQNQLWKLTFWPNPWWPYFKSEPWSILVCKGIEIIHYHNWLLVNIVNHERLTFCWPIQIGFFTHTFGIDMETQNSRQFKFKEFEEDLNSNYKVEGNLFITWKNKTSQDSNPKIHYNIQIQENTQAKWIFHEKT